MNHELWLRTLASKFFLFSFGSSPFNRNSKFLSSLALRSLIGQLDNHGVKTPFVTINNVILDSQAAVAIKPGSKVKWPDANTSLTSITLGPMCRCKLVIQFLFHQSCNTAFASCCRHSIDLLSWWMIIWLENLILSCAESDGVKRICYKISGY